MAKELGVEDGRHFTMTIANRCWLARVAFERFLLRLERGELVDGDAAAYGVAFLAAAAGDV